MIKKRKHIRQVYLYGCSLLFCCFFFHYLSTAQKNNYIVTHRIHALSTNICSGSSYNKENNKGRVIIVLPFVKLQCT